MSTDLQHGSNRGLYWRCQLGGWLGFSLLQLTPVLLGSADRTRLRSIVAGIILRALMGLLGTHLLYLCIRRRRWLHTVDGKLAVRLLAATALLSGALAGVEFLASHYLFRDDVWYRTLDARRFAQTWLALMIVVSGWTVLYVVIHELRGRRARETRAMRLEMIVQEAQLRGLRAQLNPHFLFNCLNDLREIIGENTERAQSMVTQLSALLRYSLESNQSELVPLAEELQAVKDYLALETIRFEERLRVQWSVASEAGHARVPPMLLQTLVENALKHGVARRPSGDDVAIHVRLVGEELQLEVLNSGRFPEGVPPTGVGLRNAQERIKLLFGEQASLVVENTAGGRVRALAKLPLARVEVTA